MMLIVAELTFEVKIRSRLLETKTMWVRSWPVPRIQSTRCVAGSYRPMTLFVSAVK